MFFDDFSKKKPNVNMGNKIITSKDDFMKKMKEEEKKEKQKKETEKQNQIIKMFIFKNFKSSSIFSNWKLIENIHSVNILLSSDKFTTSKKEQIAIKAIEKTITQINKFLSCKMNPLKKMILLLQSITNILKFISSTSIISIITSNSKISLEYKKMFLNAIQLSICQIEQNISQEYLIDDKDICFFYLTNFLYIFPISTSNTLLTHLSKNVSFLLILKNILGNLNKILNKSNIDLIVSFCEGISHKIILRRKNFELKNCQDYANGKVSSFLESFLLSIIQLREDNKSNVIQNVFELCLYIGKENIFSKFSEKDTLQLLNYIMKEQRAQNENSNMIISKSHFQFLLQLFENMMKVNLKSMNRAEVLKGINLLLENVFKNCSQIDPNNILNLIYFSSKAIENLYKSNYENSNLQSILEHIINKIALKFYPNLSEVIFTYSVELLKEVFPIIKTYTEDSNIEGSKNSKITLIKKNNYDKNERIFEIIAFFVLNQINYKSNYFFVEFKTTKNIYQNLPFNYFYLNFFSKYLISLFTDLISRTIFEEIEMLSQNMIIKCLKSLYLLDGEINFTPNREQFWNNMELVSKVTGKNICLLVEKMKIIPFIFPLNIRLDLSIKDLNQKIAMSNASSYYHDDEDNNFFDNYEQHFHHHLPSKLNMNISRDSIFESSFTYYLQGNLLPTGEWRITFVNKFGQKEEGIDQGGVYKEFIYKLSEEIFGTKLGLFIESSTGYLLPNKEACKLSDKYLEMYEFAGFIVARAIIGGIKIYPNLSPIFLNNILEVENSFTDLKEYDSELYKNLVALKQYEGDVGSDFGLTFSITEEDPKTHQLKNINLIPNGENIKVTNNNRLFYIKKLTEYKLTYQFFQCHNFLCGMQKVCDMEILKIFTGEELRQIIYGFDKDSFDVEDMKMNTRFEFWDFNNPEDVSTLNNLFKILNEFDEKEREKFLFFCTSLKRLPIGGFAKLQPPFVIAKASIAVPTSSTCVNMLKLPILPYKKMKDILKYVINADAGFYYA